MRRASTASIALVDAICNAKTIANHEEAQYVAIVLSAFCKTSQIWCIETRHDCTVQANNFSATEAVLVDQQSVCQQL